MHSPGSISFCQGEVRVDTAFQKQSQLQLLCHLQLILGFHTAFQDFQMIQLPLHVLSLSHSRPTDLSCCWRGLRFIYSFLYLLKRNHNKSFWQNNEKYIHGEVIKLKIPNEMEAAFGDDIYIHFQLLMWKCFQWKCFAETITKETSLMLMQR